MRTSRGRRARRAILVVTLLLSVLVIGSGALAAPPADHPVGRSTPEPQHDDPPNASGKVRDRLEPFDLAPLSRTPCSGGTAAGYPCSEVDLASFLPLSAIGGGSGNDIWGWTDRADGREYALMGRTSGTSFVDITDPENPIYLGNLPTESASSTWRDIKVYANHAYIVSEAANHGMQVFDLTQLRSVASPPATFSATTVYTGFDSAHNIVINEETGYAYAVGTDTCSGGLHMVNIQSPASPSFAGCYSNDGYTHDAQCVIYNGPDVTYQTREICFNANEDTLTIVDVENKAAPVQLSRTGYTGVGYAHQGWLTEDHRYLLLDDELDEQSFGHNTRTYIWDVVDLDNPSLIGSYTASTPAIDHNLYIVGNFAYQANYRAGLRILDISGIASGSLSEVGYFDVYPSDDNPNFNGSWSVYPFFSSGSVIVSGMEQGLFVLRPSLATEFALTTPDPELAICADGSDTTTVAVEARRGYTGTVTLSTVGLPTGASSTLSDNPVTVPATTTLTLTTSGVATGTHPFQVEGSDGTLSDTLALRLEVWDAPPNAATLVGPADGTINHPVAGALTWSAAAQAGTFTIEIATDPAFSTIVERATVTPPQLAYVPTGLRTSTTYYWRVRSANVCGQGADSPIWSFTTEPGPGDCALGVTPSTLLFDDFESGAAGWTHSAGVGTDTWVLDGSRPHSGTTAWYATDIPSVSEQWLVSPPVALPAGQGPLTLQFWNAQELENRAAGGCYDAGLLDISSDGGATWSQVPGSALLTDPYDGAISLAFQNPRAGDDGWCGDPQGYLNSIVDLDAYAGQSVQFRFTLATDNSVSHPGWWIDDVRVQSCPAVGPTATPTPSPTATVTPTPQVSAYYLPLFVR